MNLSRMRTALLVLPLLSLLRPAHAVNRLFIPDRTVMVGDTDVTVPVRLDNDQSLYGFSLSVATDATKLTIDGLDLTGTVVAGAEYSSGQTLAGGARITWGVVLDISDPFDVNRVVPVGTDLHLANLRFGLLCHFLPFTLPLAEIVLGIAACGEVAAQTHRDGAGRDLRHARRENDRSRIDRARQSRCQRERNGQPVRHADDDIADDCRRGEVLLCVRCLWHSLFRGSGAAQGRDGQPAERQDDVGEEVEEFRAVEEQPGLVQAGA